MITRQTTNAWLTSSTVNGNSQLLGRARNGWALSDSAVQRSQHLVLCAVAAKGLFVLRTHDGEGAQNVGRIVGIQSTLLALSYMVVASAYYILIA